MGVKQVVASHVRKLDFGVADENTPTSSEPEPKIIRKSMSDISAYTKKTIEEVSRRLQDEISNRYILLITHFIDNDNPNSPSKIQYKHFAKDMKEWEKDGFSKTMKNVFEKIFDLPRKLHWKLLLDLADFAKRESEFKEAAILFKIITHIQPYAYQGWLEHAKMEEELGNIDRCRTLLKRGLKFNPLNENLFLKSLKVEEKEENFVEVKKLIASLKNHRIEDTCKMILEGALFEGRCGNIKSAQKVLKYLCKKCYMHGPMFTAAAQFEERIGSINTAIQICEDGLEYNCSHGPLWFMLIKLAAKVSDDYEFRYATGFDNLLNEAIRFKTDYGQTRSAISPELRWKLYLEAAQYQETSDRIDLARKYLTKSITTCNSQKLKWKVWIMGARIEARIGSLDTAKSLIERSMLEIPQKKQSIGFLELAKYYELIGKDKIWSKILSLARKTMETDWKIFFESVLAEIRNGRFDQAENQVKFSLRTHFLTGRLWATLIQLKHARIENAQDSKKAYSIFLQANRKIPKSGEVWCEGARLLSSPLSHKFDLNEAEKYLNFAIQFTPQYGDSFLELYRIYKIQGVNDKQIIKYVSI